MAPLGYGFHVVGAAGSSTDNLQPMSWDINEDKHVHIKPPVDFNKGEATDICAVKC